MQQKQFIKVDKSEGETPIFPPAAGSPTYVGESRTEKIGSSPMNYLIIVIFLLFSFFLMFHTFGYDGKTKTILIASRLWSDFGANIPLIRSFSMGENFERILAGRLPQYPIYPGEPIRYHFLFYALVGILEKAGLRLDWALNIPSAMGFFLLLLGIFKLSYSLFHSYKVSVLSVVFFLFNGSLSFIRFFAHHPLGSQTLKQIVSAAEFPAFAPWGPGEVSAFWNLNVYTNQRHLAPSFAVGLWFLVWVLSPKKTTVGALLWGLGIGSLPYFHQPMLLVMAVLLGSSFLLFQNARRMLLVTAVTAVFTAIPQLLTMPQNAALAWYPGYLIHDRFTIATSISYWFQNLGLHAAFIPIGFIFLPTRAKKVLAPLFAIFLIANIFKFSVEVAGSHKFFNFALILGNMITAYIIVKFFSSINVITIIKFIFAMGITIALTLSGVIDFFVVKNDVKGAVADVPSDTVATWIAANTPKDAVFLNSRYFYHPASLAGRNIFIGWPYFAWSAGYVGNRVALLKQIYESRDPAVFCPILTEGTIDYVTVEPSDDQNLATIDEDYFIRNFTPRFRDPARRMAVFTTEDLCTDIDS